MSRRWISSITAWVVGAALVAGACKPSDGTGPTVPYTPPPGVNFRDPQTALTGVTAFEAAWGTPAMRSVTGLASIVSVAGTPPAHAAAPQCGAGGPESEAVSVFSVLPDSALGRIYVYDTASGHFQVGSDTGGPATGVEFLLPAVDTLNILHIPLQTVGTLDLFDVTPVGAPLTLLSLVAGTGGNGSADYTFVDSGTASSWSGILSGRVAGAGHVFSFRDSATGVLAQTTAFATVSDSGRGLAMVLKATRTQSDLFDYFYSLDYTFQSPGQSVRLLGDITVYCLIPTIGLTVTVNDSDFAIVNTGTSGAVITGLSDSTVTPAQDSAIRALIRGQNELFTWLNALAQPARQFLAP
jgi:hypothetical protein